MLLLWDTQRTDSGATSSHPTALLPSSPPHPERLRPQQSSKTTNSNTTAGTTTAPSPPAPPAAEAAVATAAHRHLIFSCSPALAGHSCALIVYVVNVHCARALVITHGAFRALNRSILCESHAPIELVPCSRSLFCTLHSRSLSSCFMRALKLAIGAHVRLCCPSRDLMRVSLGHALLGLVISCPYAFMALMGMLSRSRALMAMLSCSCSRTRMGMLS